MKHAITAALDVICFLCDRQQKKMQNEMRNKVSLIIFVLIIFNIL